MPEAAGANDRHAGIKTSCWSPLSEADRWKSAADAEGMSLSAWLRRAANRAVEIERKQEKVREVLS